MQLQDGMGCKRKAWRRKRSNKVASSILGNKKGGVLKDMCGAVAKVVIRQAAKQASGQVAKRLTKQTVKRLAIRGEKSWEKVLL